MTLTDWLALVVCVLVGALVVIAGGHMNDDEFDDQDERTGK
jgi:hypothetical protein